MDATLDVQRTNIQMHLLVYQLKNIVFSFSWFEIIINSEDQDAARKDRGE